MERRQSTEEKRGTRQSLTREQQKGKWTLGWQSSTSTPLGCLPRACRAGMGFGTDLELGFRWPGDDDHPFTDIRTFCRSYLRFEKRNMLMPKLLCLSEKSIKSMPTPADDQPLPLSATHSATSALGLRESDRNSQYQIWVSGYPGPVVTTCPCSEHPSSNLPLPSAKS